MGSPTCPVGRSIYTVEHQRLVALLRELRENAGLRQADVAKRLRRPQSFVSKYEAGQRRLDLVELSQLAGVFGLSLFDLVEQFEATRPRRGTTRRTRF